MDFVIDKHGRRRQLGPGEHLRDGERVNVPMLVMDGELPAQLMDGKPFGIADAEMHRPGYRGAPAAIQDRKEGSRDAYVSLLGDAWKAER